jgi:DNA-binding transcriptional LysR family regulator
VWQTVDLRELRLFLTLAEELHFGRTAERLRLTPSRVSQSLRALEHKLGAQLVHRTSRRVRLTPFGEQLLRELGPALEQLDGVLERSNAAARTLEGTLRLGLFSGPAGGPHLVEVINAFEALHRECNVDVVLVSWDDPFGRLRANEVELMASWVPLNDPDLVVGPTLTSQPRVLAVAHDHPLADRDSIDVEELADHRVPRFDNWPKELHEAIGPFRTPGGRPIPHTRIALGDRAVLDVAVLVARGELVWPTVASAAPYMGGDLDLVFVPIRGMPPLRSALVWRRPARDPKLRAFLRVAREVLRDRTADHRDHDGDDRDGEKAVGIARHQGRRSGRDR